MCTCARLAKARSATPKYGASRNSLKPCFVEKRSGHARDRPGEKPVGVGMHEVRVQDRRPHAHEIRGELRKGDRVDVGTKRDRVERDAARLERAREVPSPRLVLVQHQHADVPAALAQRAAAARGDAPPSRRCRRPSADGGSCRSASSRGNGSERARRPSARPSGACDDGLAQLGPAARDRASAAARRGPPRSSRVEPELGGQQIVEHRIRREHGEARRGRFVDDLVRRSRRACCSRARGCRAKSAGTCARGTGPPSSAPGKLDSRLALVLLERRVGAVRRPRARLRAPLPAGSSRAPSPASSGRARARARRPRGRLGARELADVDAVADRRAPSASAAGTSARRPTGCACRPSPRRGRRRAPSSACTRARAGSGAAARAARRGPRRAAPCARRRRSARAQLAGERALEPRAALQPASARRTRARARFRHAPSTAVSQRTTSSSTRSASARTIGTVAARTGSPGSSLCVAKISLRIRRSRGRRA